MVGQVAALRFFFVRTLKRRFPPDSIPYPKYTHHRVPKILSPDEVARLIDAASNLQARAILMLLYSTGVRRSELVRLRVEDIDSERMIVYIRQGKGGKDRDVPLSSKLLDTLREYWRWRKPKTWLFPRGIAKRGDNQHLTDKAVWYVCAEAARHAGLKKRVAPLLVVYESYANSCDSTAAARKPPAMKPAPTEFAPTWTDTPRRAEQLLKNSPPK